MGRIHVLGIALVAIGIGVGAYLMAFSSASDMEPGARFSGVPTHIDPACLWPVLDATQVPDAPAMPASVPLTGCAPKGALSLEDDGWARVHVEEGEDGTGSRWTGARIEQVLDPRRLVLQAYDNWGGSGVFASLVTGRLEGTIDRLTALHAFGFGDRCHGGLVSTRVDETGDVRALAAMTPMDVVMASVPGPLYDKQWEMAHAQYGAALDDVADCAVCCSAVRREYVVDMSGGVMREAGLRYDAQVERLDVDNPLSRCLDEAVREQAGPDGLATREEAVLLAPAFVACFSKTRSE